MSASDSAIKDASLRRRVRNGALGLGLVAAGALFWLHRVAGVSQSPLMDPIDPKKRANTKLVRALVIMTAGSFAFGWALVPLYDVFCKAAGIGNAEARDGRSTARESVDPNREVTIEFLAEPASVGSFDFQPKVASMRIHPGKLYDAIFHAKNLTNVASVAQAVPSISPTGTAQYFHKTECFCFSPQKFSPARGTRPAGAIHRGSGAARHRGQADFGLYHLRHDAAGSAALGVALPTRLT